MISRSKLKMEKTLHLISLFDTIFHCDVPKLIEITISIVLRICRIKVACNSGL